METVTVLWIRVDRSHGREGDRGGGSTKVRDIYPHPTPHPHSLVFESKTHLPPVPGPEK